MDNQNHKPAIPFRRAFVALMVAAQIIPTASIGHAANQQNIDRIRTAIAEGMPLAGSWNMGSNTSAGYDPTWQLTAIEEGYPILPWFQHWPRTHPVTHAQSYFEAALRFAAQHRLPIALRTTQWEDELNKTHIGNPVANNPCHQNLDGTFTPELSPVGALQPWYDIGFLNTDNPVMKKMQEIYPDPPLVLWVSNNEAQLYGGSILQEKRYVDQYGTAGDEVTHMTRIHAGWSERFKKMTDGARAGLVAPAWKTNSKWIGYSGTGREFGSVAIADTRYKFVLDTYITKGYDGPSTSMYVHDWSTNMDHIVRSPQIEAGNIVFFHRRAKQSNPNFFGEVSVTEGGPGMISRYGRLGQSFTSERYRGYIEYLLWTIRPPSMREYRNSTETRGGTYYLFKEVLKATALVHNDSRLARFWKQGKLVPNKRLMPSHSGPTYHPYSYAIPPEYKADERWFVLNADVNEPINSWYFDRPHSDEVRVFAMALEIGAAPNREWLMYAHSPLMTRENVGITLGDYGVVKVRVELGGSFYFINEATGQITGLTNNRPPNAGDDQFSTVEDTPMTVNVLANDSDPDGDPLRVVGVLSGANGKAVLDDNGIVTYTPNLDFYGTDTFIYTVSDGKRGSRSATVVMEVTTNLDAPTASDLSAWTESNTPVTIQLDATDPDSPTLTYEIVDQPVHGVLSSDDKDKTFIYTPRSGFRGNDSFTFKASDGKFESNISRVFVFVGPIDTALVGWWRMDDGQGIRAMDFSRRKNHGTLINGAEWSPGILQGSLALDGVADRCELPKYIINSGKGSMALWIKTGKNYRSDQGIIFYGAQNFYGGGDGFGGEKEIHLHINTDNTPGFFALGDPDPTRLKGTKAINDNKWHHLGVTWETGGQAVLYVDGKAVANAAYTGDTFTSDFCSRLGKPTQGSDRLFQGLMDDTRLYSRALSAEEMAVLANPTANIAPTVNAGEDQTLNSVAALLLSGSMSDDGLPAPPSLSARWSKISGPGEVSFQNPFAASTYASFSSQGVYTLRLRAGDGEAESHDDVTITVNTSVQGGAGSPEANTNLVKPSIGQNAKFTYEVISGGQVTITIFDRQGHQVWDLSVSREPGTFIDEWNGKNELGELVASGLYVAEINNCGKKTRKKIVLLK